MNDSSDILNGTSHLDDSDSDYGDLSLTKNNFSNNLQEENAQLTIQNSTLKSQFDQAIELANQSKLIQSELLKEKEDNRQLKEQNAILNAQLELLITTNNDLNRKIDDNKRAFDEKFSLKESQTSQEVFQLKTQLQSRIEDLLKENDQLKAELSQKEMHERVEKAQKQQMLNTLSHIYNTSFNNFDEAFSYAQNHQDGIRYIETDHENQIDMMLMDLESVKKKYSEEQRKRKQLEKAVKSMSADLEEAQSKLKQYKDVKDETDQLKSKISEMEEDKDLTKSDYEHQIKLLTEKNEKLTKEIKDLYSSPKSMQQTQFQQRNQQFSQYDQQKQQFYQQQQQQNTISVNCNHQNMNDNNAFPPFKVYEPCTVCHKHEELSETNAMLLEQLEEIRKSKQQITEELESETEKNNCLTQQYYKLKGEFDGLDTKIKAQQNELNHMKDIEEKNKTLQTQVFQLKSENKNLKYMKDKQTKEINDFQNKVSGLTADNTILKQNIQNLKDNERKLTNEIEQLEEKLTESHNDFMKIQQFNKPVPQLTEEDVLPSESFRTILFEDALNYSIEKIANSTSIHPQTKIQSIYKAISSYYENKNKEYQKKVQSEQKEYCAIIDDYEHAFVDISIIVNGSAEYQNLGNLVDSIKKLKEKYDKLRLSNSMQSKTLEYIVKSFDFSKDMKVEDQIDQKCQYINKLQENYISKNKKVKELKQLVRCMQSETTKQITNLETNNKQKAAKIQAMKIQMDQQSDVIKEQKVEISNMKKEKREFEAEQEATMRKLKIDCEDQINQNSINCSAQIGELTKKIEELQAINDTLTMNNRNLDDNAKQLKKAYESQKITITNLKEMQKKAELDSKAAVANVIDQNDAEKELIIENHNKEIQEYMTIQKSMKVQIDSITHEKKTLMTKIDKLNSTIKKLKESNNSLNQTIQIKDSEISKSNQLFDAAKAAAVSQAEVKFNAKMAEKETLFTLEKQRVFSFAFQYLSSFFPDIQEINENTYRNLILQASQKLANNNQI